MTEYRKEMFDRATKMMRERAAEDPWPIDDRPLQIGSGDHIVMSSYAEARMAAAETLQRVTEEGEDFPGQGGMASLILAMITDFNALLVAAQQDATTQATFDEIERANREGKGTHHG
jgi:hypothetical protein